MRTATGSSSLGSRQRPSSCPGPRITPDAATADSQARACRHRQTCVSVTALHIDRRKHMELAWQRQAERETKFQQIDLSQGSNGMVLKVDDLEQLDALLEKAGTNMVILMMTSRTCGVCKTAMKRFEEMARDAAAARARVVFLQADIHNDYDHYSDVGLWYKVKAVPTFLFIDEGAVVRRLSLRDIRRMGGNPIWVQNAMADDLRRLQSVFTEVMFRRAPSARS